MKPWSHTNFAFSIILLVLKPRTMKSQERHEHICWDFLSTTFVVGNGLPTFFQDHRRLASETPWEVWSWPVPRQYTWHHRAEEQTSEQTAWSSLCAWGRWRERERVYALDLELKEAEYHYILSFHSVSDYLCWILRQQRHYPTRKSVFWPPTLWRSALA